MINQKVVFFLMTFFLLLTGCSHHHKVKSPSQLSDVKTYHHLGFAGDQAGVDFQRYKDAGYKRVVNLREVGEEGYSEDDFKREKASAKAAGLEYYNRPFMKKSVADDAVTEEMMYDIEAAVNPKNEKKVATLVHCSTATRASAWLLWHMAIIHGEDIKSAREIAYKVGPQEGVDKAYDAVETLIKKTKTSK